MSEILLQRNPPIKKDKKYKENIEYTRKFIKRLRYFIKTKHEKIQFEKLKRTIHGYYEHEKNLIVVDYRKLIIPTLIHEFAHHIYPEWAEYKIENLEKKIMKYITKKQSINLLKLIVQYF